MRKFVHSSRELFPHLVDTRQNYGVYTMHQCRPEKNWRCTGTTHDPMTYIRKNKKRLITTLTADKHKVKRYIADIM